MKLLVYQVSREETSINLTNISEQIGLYRVAKKKRTANVDQICQNLVIPGVTF